MNEAVAQKTRSPKSGHKTSKVKKTS